MKKTEPPVIKNKTICFFNTNKAWGGGEKWHLEYASGSSWRGTLCNGKTRQTQQMEYIESHAGIEIC